MLQRIEIVFFLLLIAFCSKAQQAIPSASEESTVEFCWHIVFDNVPPLQLKYNRADCMPIRIIQNHVLIAEVNVHRNQILRFSLTPAQVSSGSVIVSGCLTEYLHRGKKHRIGAEFRFLQKTTRLFHNKIFT